MPCLDREATKRAAFRQRCEDNAREAKLRTAKLRVAEARKETLDVVQATTAAMAARGCDMATAGDWNKIRHRIEADFVNRVCIIAEELGLTIPEVML